MDETIADRTPSHDPKIDELIAQARTAERGAQRELARENYELALRLMRPHENSALASSLLRWIGRTHLNGGDAEAALECYEAALSAALSARDSSAASHALNCLASVHQTRGQLDEAERLYGEARSIAINLDEPKLGAMIEQNLGTIANIRGDLAGALSHYNRSLVAYRSLHLEEFVGPLLNNIGRLQTDQGRWDEAEETFKEAYDVCHALGDRCHQVLVETNRTRLAIARGDLGLARSFCDSAYELSRVANDEQWLGLILKHYGIIYRETKHQHLAEEYLDRARSIAERDGDVLLAAETAGELAQLFRLQNRNRDVLRQLNHAHRLFSDLRARRELADVGSRIQRLEETFLRIVQDWGESIESKDTYTQGHCVRVAEMACRMAELDDFDPSLLIWFRMGALLHDVGKVVVPTGILSKPGKLTDEEFALMKTHPAAGAELLADSQFPWDILPMVRHHHEKWDGLGYPDGLRGESIPRPARILAVADVFDALTTDRSYRRAFTREAAMEIMESEVGTSFDPEVFSLFRTLMAQEAFPVRDAQAEPVTA